MSTPVRAGVALMVAPKPGEPAVQFTDAIGRALPAELQARQRIYDDLLDAKLELLLGEPVRPMAIFGPLSLDQLERRIRVAEVLRFEAELEAKRLQNLPLQERTKQMEAFSEGVKHIFQMDMLELAKSNETVLTRMVQEFKEKRRALMDPTTAITPTAGAAPSPGQAAPGAFVEKATAFLSTTTGKVAAGAGAVALIWFFTRGE